MWVEDRFLVQWDNPESLGWHEYDFIALGDEHGS